MASLLDVVDSYLKEMGLPPDKCMNENYQDCRFLNLDSADMVIIARDDPFIGRTLGFIARLRPFTPRNAEEYYKKLLSLNFEFVHGAFAVDCETDEVIIIDNLQADHIDFDEFYASVNAVAGFLWTAHSDS